MIRRMSAANTLTIDDVRDFFGRVLMKDAATLGRIAAAGPDIQLQPAGFVFTLPALHILLDPEEILPYRDFSKLLYHSTLNQDLSAFDAEITVFQSTGKTDTSLYCLRQRPPI